MSSLSFQHRYIPGEPGAPVLILLHGTGGSEDDLIPLGQTLLPRAGLLSPRGKVLESGMHRFFRRLAEGVFDEEDLFFRTEELVSFIDAAAEQYGFDRRNVVAVGYSNGANIAASVLLRFPGALKGAILLRPMLPFVPVAPPSLAGVAVFLASGRYDPMVKKPQVDALATHLSAGGADVTHEWSEAGHQLTSGEIQVATAWAATHFKTAG